MHFVRALYADKTTEEGFIVNVIKTIDKEDDMNLYIPAQKDTISLDDSHTIIKYIADIYQHRADSMKAIPVSMKLKQWVENPANKIAQQLIVKADSSDYNAYYFMKDTIAMDKIFINRFNVNDSSAVQKIKWQNAVIKSANQKFNLNIPENVRNRIPFKMSILFTVPINTKEFINKKDNDIVFLFDDSWQVTYTKEMKEVEYLNENFLNREAPGYQQSVISMPERKAINIFSNGYYTGEYSIIVSGYWAYEKTDKILPLDYVI